ncbi:DUF416 family protein [Roseofilum sp. Belize Diploria]|uniref:DUF416 family protein n=1 Tax=Roseofilum sp. Belize Diploria TaxID=2821501 RepID=UPI001B0F36DA|nr:DUF416 family protein [Roseofilum sp. Belize Diploria]MBP0011484.1 DUF416 family protein [Roseofilum sp. Belize Diploria]
MTLEFFEFENLEFILENLSPFHKVAFSASICERMLPIYEIFSQEEGLGDPEILRNSLDEIWKILHGKPAEVEQINTFLKKCEQEVIDSESITKSQFDLEPTLAIEALCTTLESCLEPTTKRAIRVACCVTNAIFAFFQVRQEEADLSWEEKSFIEQKEFIINHQLVQQEIQKQEEDLQCLQDSKTLDKELLEWLQNSSSNKCIVDLSWSLD